MNDDTKINEYMEDIKKWCKDPIKILEYEVIIRKSIEKGKEEDHYLRTTDSISDDFWKRIIDAIKYDSVLTVGWATKKLCILYNRSKLGEKIFIPYLNIYLQKDNFKKVICKEFSKCIYKEILELYQSSKKHKQYKTKPEDRLI